MARSSSFISLHNDTKAVTELQQPQTPLLPHRPIWLRGTYDTRIEAIARAFLESNIYVSGEVAISLENKIINCYILH